MARRGWQFGGELSGALGQCAFPAPLRAPLGGLVEQATVLAEGVLTAVEAGARQDRRPGVPDCAVGGGGDDLWHADSNRGGWIRRLLP